MIIRRQTKPARAAACVLRLCGVRMEHGQILNLILMAIGDFELTGGASREEIELVRGMSTKGGGSAEEVYRQHSERVFRFIYWRIGEQTEDAEDLVLETFLSAIDLSRSFDGRSSVFVWLCGVAKLRMIDRHRRRSRGKRSAAQVSLQDIHESDRNMASSPEALVDRIGATQLMDAALLQLKEDEREALLLQHVDGMSVREVAVFMRRSEDAIDSLSRRAKGKLREALLALMVEEDYVG